MSLVRMYWISGSGWLDIWPFFAIRIRPKYCLSPDSATGLFTYLTEPRNAIIFQK